jgi:alpha/beta superfamily hydrolase
VKPERVSFPAQGGEAVLEGSLLDGGGPGVVVSHPHPLHGGDMDHPVVEAVWRAAGEAGFKSLRYNFRSVGASTGTLTQQSPLPLDDLAGAMAFLGGGTLRAIGYSYGARATLHALCANFELVRAVLVSLPTRLPVNRSAMSNLILGRRISGEQYKATPDLDLLPRCPRPVRLVAGSLDPLFEAEKVRALGFEPAIVEGVNHFFSRRRGNQAPHPDDAALLAKHTLDFL